jgi:hypothetical protein
MCSFLVPKNISKAATTQNLSMRPLFGPLCSSLKKIRNQMNKILIPFLICLTFYGCRQKYNTIDKPKVDQRVELLSIVFRLAECQEYSSEDFKLYTDKIKEHYQPHKNHELIQFVKKIREEKGVSYDAVMSMAIHLSNDFSPLVEFTDKVPDERWGKENAQKFAQLLRAFYEDSQSEQFFSMNENLYREASRRFLPVYEKLDIDWYTSFYGKEPKELFSIVNGLGNGEGNYGPAIEHANSQREVYAIMGTWSIDSLGMAEFPVDDYFPTLLHEFNHSFVNYLLEKNPELFKDNGDILYKTVENEMKKQAYGNWQIMFNEALVRAAVIKYMKDHNFDQKEIDEEINTQLNRGFLWIQELVGELEKYDSSRNQYRTLEEYMPNIANAYARYVKNIDTYKENFDKKRPKIISISEFSNGDQKVKPALKRVTINFDQQLSGKGYSISYGEKGEKAFPKMDDISYSKDKKSVIMEWHLESNKEYQFVLTGMSFKTPQGIPMKDFEINFKTE